MESLQLCHRSAVADADPSRVFIDCVEMCLFQGTRVLFPDFACLLPCLFRRYKTGRTRVASHDSEFLAKCRVTTEVK